MTLTVEAATHSIEQSFAEAGVTVVGVEPRIYPDETVFLVWIPEGDLELAAVTAGRADKVLQDLHFNGFVSIRASRDTIEADGDPVERVTSLEDTRVSDLQRLLISRSRATDMMPSLSYVPNAAANVLTVTTQRHQLIFGRRGAGKTALMAEARRIVQADGQIPVWMNIQTFRLVEPARLLAHVGLATITAALQALTVSPSAGGLRQSLSTLADELERILGSHRLGSEDAQRLMPRLQMGLRRFADVTGQRIYIFLDDFHYLERSSQAWTLDYLHGAVRDTDTWLKVASIRNLTRWYSISDQAGLEAPHDADHIDLDLTLTEPTKAKDFLEQILTRFCKHVGISSVSQLFNPRSRDRLVLASGGVPRDYLTLSSSALTRALDRSSSARKVGVEDVNGAAGDAAQVKVDELQDDLAADEQEARTTLEILNKLRSFCLDEFSCSYFLIEFRDRESHQDEYARLVSLVDLRLAHLVNPSISDPQAAGVRYEVHMIDLSQFSGHRLKRGIRVLDFEKGQIVQKQTGIRGAKEIGNTPLKLIAILRRGPVLDLQRFAPASGD